MGIYEIIKYILFIRRIRIYVCTYIVYRILYTNGLIYVYKSK